MFLNLFFGNHKITGTTARQVFCCDCRNGLNKLTKIGYCLSKFIICLRNYKLLVDKILIAQMMNSFPFSYSQSDKRSEAEKNVDFNV